MSSILRLGVTLIALLTLYTMFTVYHQLREAREIFNDLARSGMLGYSDGKTLILSQGGRSGLYSRDPSGYSNENNDHNKDKRFRAHLLKNSHSASRFRPIKTKYTERFQRHFQEDIYTIEKQIFEFNAKPTSRPRRNFQEKHKYSVVRNNTGIRTMTANSSKSQTELRASPAREHSKSFPVTRDSRKNVMILAYRRSGSSFLGEMFNRNPDVFYLFEPIQPLERIAGRGKFPLLYETLVGNLLDTIYTCSFKNHPFFVNFISRSPFRLKSNILKSHGLCDATVTPLRMNLCQDVNATLLSRLCHASSHTVIKTIRANVRMSFAFSSRSARGRAMAFKIIHLVRDPRAIISSRLMNLENVSKILPGNITQRRDEARNKSIRVLTRAVRVASRNLCSRIYSDIKHGEELLERYAMIRYEDAAMRPLTAYERIYEFAGIDQSSEVSNWLEENTKSDKNRDYYSTSRNATASVHGWRSMLSLSLVKEVQRQCGQLMRLLGYVLVQDEKQLKDTSKDLVVPLTNGFVLQKQPLTKPMLNMDNEKGPSS